MKYFLYILAFILCMCATVKPVSADTSIPSGLISKDTILLKSKSPYVLSGMTTVKQGIKFSIESGVKIVFNGGGLFLNKSNLTGKSFTIESKSFGNNALITCDGCSIDLQGVQVEGSPQSFISAWNHSAVVLAEVEINFAGNSQNTTGIQVFNNSTLIVSDSIFSRLHKAIELFNNSTSTITNSYFAYNMHGIYAFNSDMHISQNDFENNRIAIEYFSNDGFDHRVDARDNWWGNKDAPIQKEYASNVLQEDMNVLVGEIEYTPWSLMPHKLKKEEGSSNILFLPGLMGSRLYKKDTFENQLWEPNRNKDVRNLFLTPLGKSMQSGIYTRDIIDKTNIVGGVTNLDQNLYKDFMVHMNSLVKNKTIQAWKSAPYDWRYSADTILEDGISVDGSTGSITSHLVQELIVLAKTSKTKRVTIVSHSNGGFIAKQLMIELKRQHLDMLVDKLILVAMPEYGTPQAITGLLYGHDQSIAGGIILHTDTAKALGVNMPSSYALLPSKMYFSYAAQPVRMNTLDIHTKSELNIALNQNATINNTLLHKADELHRALDTWIPQKGTSVYQIVGTGLLTVTGFTKDTKQKPLPIYSKTGDGVVQDMYNTARHTYGRTGSVFTINLGNTQYKHMNIMNAPDTLNHIDTLITSTEVLPETNRIEVLGEEYSVIRLLASTTPIAQKTISSKDMMLKHSATGQFDTLSSSNSFERFELIDSDIQYVSQKDLNELRVEGNTGDSFDISILSVNSNSASEAIFENVHSPTGTELSILGSEKLLEIHFPLLNEKVYISPTKEITYDSSFRIAQSVESASTTAVEDIAVRVERIKAGIIKSNITGYVKTRYIRRLDVVAKSKNPIGIDSMKQSLELSIAGIEKYAYNPILRNRYSKLREDYAYIVYLLQAKP